MAPLKMRAAISLLMLLFCVCSGAAPASTQPDISTEPQELLRDMVVELRGALKSMEARQAASEAKAETPKVAFFAGLPYGYTHAHSQGWLYLVWSQVTVNVGNAYDSTTGYFKAPVRGVYVFRFDITNREGGSVQLHVFKNNAERVMLRESYDNGGVAYVSGGLTLLLEVGDTIMGQIPPGSRLYNDPHNHSTFSGSLLFTV
ncbi:complement C1q-like protein 3 [Engraulis encrasicolus]|uniref:complement C1q-like protein 3 n=1 Tax=Engraulis encrasicolus TaxID=184585 RepID=UPI002FD69691